MAWLLVWFLPGHTRGRITLGAKDADSCCVQKRPSCCAADESPQPGSQMPTSRDRANCAVCFWAAGLLHTVPVSFTILFLERHHEHLATLATQFRSIQLPRETLPRGPPCQD
jgi:hypothetical protein